MNIPVIIEVTRRCNMECAHCLRGCQQNKDISIAHIDELLSRVDYINSITFTGGEPSLNVKAIEYTLEQCKDRGIEVGSFYIATNGKIIDESFIIACLKWYAYCYEKGMCSVNVSNDGWHAEEGNYNTELLDGLSFFSRKHSEESVYYYQSAINEGNAYENGIGARENTDYGFKIDDELFFEGDVYLNVNGDIISGCDWSYESQEEHKVCHVSELSLDKLKEYEA